MDPETVAERIDEVLARSAGRLLDPSGVVAYDDGQLVGVVLVERGWSVRADDAPSPPELTWLSVRGDQRSQGVASAMLAEAVALLNDSGVTRVTSSLSGAKERRCGGTGATASHRSPACSPRCVASTVTDVRRHRRAMAHRDGRCRNAARPRVHRS